MIIIGSLLMVNNIVRYIKFIIKSKDVMTAGKKGHAFLRKLGLFLLTAFLAGYVSVVVFGSPDLVMAGILFGGSIYVSIILTIMFSLVAVVKDRSMELSEVLIGVIEARDPNLNGHSLAVRDLTKLLYEYMPKPVRSEVNLVSLEYAALLHDLGKLGIPEAVLNKPGALNDEEWEIVRQHPKIGAEILKKITSFEAIRHWIEYHHERVDGKGYYRISEKEIPLSARMIAVADTYSAIRMKRAYKPEKTHEEAIEIMKGVAGTQLDAMLVTRFMMIPEDLIEKCIENRE